MGDDMNMQIVLEAVDQSQEAFKGIDDALSGVQKLADDLSKAFDSFAQSIGQAFTTATADVAAVNKPLEDIVQSADQAATAVEEITKPLEDISKAADDASKSVEDITKPLDDVIESADKVSQSVEDVAKSAEATGQQAADGLKPMDDEIKKIKDSILMTEEELKKVVDVSSIKSLSGAAVDAENVPISELKKLYAQQTGNKAIVQGGEGGGHGEGGLFGMQGQMDSMYAGMSLGAVAAPIDAGLGASIDQFAQFDQAMRLVNQEMGLSQTGFQNLETAVLNLSNSTGISAQDLSAGLYNVVASGVTNTSDALTMLQTAAEGAKAGNTDLNTATKALNAVMGAYGMNAKDASNIMDVMFTAVNNGQMHFDDLARSVGASATSAASAGVSYTELAAAQATLTNVGKNAESASQNLNSLIMGMIAPTAGATKEAKSLGIEWDAQALKAHGLSYMINEAVKATHGNSEELKKLVPNQRAYMAVLALGSNAHKEYTDTLNKMKDAHGATAAALEEYDKGAGDAIEKMKTSIVNAGIALGAAFAPAITKVTDAISKLAQWFSNLSPGAKEFLGVTLAVVGGLATLGASFFMVISGVGALVSGFKLIRDTFIAVSAAEGVMDALNPVGWVVLAVAALAAAAIAIYAYWGQIKQFLISTYNYLNQITGGAFGQIVGSIVSYLKELFSFWGQEWTAVSQFLVTTWQQIKNAVTEAWAYIGPTIIGAVQKVATFWKSVWPELKQLFIEVWNLMKIALAPIAIELYTIISGAIGLIRGIWGPFWKTVGSVLKMDWDFIVGLIRTSWDIITGIFKVVLDLLTGNWSKAWTDMKTMLGNVWNDIKSMFTSMINDAFQFGANFVHMIASGISSAISSVKAAVSNVAGAIKSYLGFHSPTEEGPASESDVWAPNFVNMFAGGLTKGASTIAKAAGTMISPLGSTIGGTLNTGVAMAGAYGQAAGGGAPVFNITVTGNITKNEQELAKIVSREIYKQAKTQGKF